MPDLNGDELDRRARARVGTVLDEKYLLERLLGFGGMAAVYAARHRNGHRAAVKLLHPEIARDGDIRARFLSEGYASNRVEHAGAVRVLDDDVVRSGDDQGTAYLVMELLEGESVHARARRGGGALPEDEVLAIAEGVLDVLEAAHARGIVHRDLKPDNLFLVRGDDGTPRVKVLDFGIARIADAALRTNVGQTLGTPSYMAPEQARGLRDQIDGRTDLFALGATMFRLITGRRVHDGESATEILAKMAALPAPKLHSIAPHVSPAVAAIVDRALQFERDARYRDAAEMRQEVRAARADAAPSSRSGVVVSPPRAMGFSAGAEPTGLPRSAEAFTVAAGAIPSEPLPPTAVHAAALPATIVRPAQPSRRALAVIIAAGAAFLLLMVLVLVVVLRSSGDEPAPPGTEREEEAPSSPPVIEKEDPSPPTNAASASAAPPKPAPVAPLPGKGKGKKKQ